MRNLSRARAFWAWIGICALTLLSYGPALGSGFVWDDDAHLPKVAMRSLHGLGRIWFELGATQQYYPVLFSAFWVEHRLWGDAALGYHLTNILLHVTSAWLFALVLRRLAIPGAWLGALLFALHPVCVESVAWISEQKNTLSTVFYLLAALAYLSFSDCASETRTARQSSRAAGFYVLATGLFILALLSKTVAATLPAALLVVFWWKRGRLAWKGDVRPLIPWLGLGAAAGLFSAWVERTYLGAQGADFALGAVQRCLVAGRAVCFYLGKLLWPANLIFIYPRWRVNASEGWQYLFPLAAFALVGALWLIRGRTRAPLAALLFFLGSLFPTLGFLNVYAFIFSYVTDHWNYLASLGIIALAAAGWGKWARSLPRSGASLPGVPHYAAAALLCVLGTLTWRQCRAYHDPETFYRVILARNPDSWMARNNLGIWYGDHGDLAKEIPQLEEALRLKPDYVEGHDNLGEAWAKIPGRQNDAIAQYQEALRLNPDYAEAHNNLGSVWLELPGRQNDAIAQFEEALRLKPGLAEAHYNLGAAWANAPERLNDAIAQYQEALRLKPDLSEAHMNLGNAWASVGHMNDAITQYQEALRLKPDFAQAHYNLGVVWVNTPGHLEEAIAQFEEALRLKPDYNEARQILAQIRASRP